MRVLQGVFAALFVIGALPSITVVANVSEMLRNDQLSTGNSGAD
jgi:hypothetical protein